MNALITCGHDFGAMGMAWWDMIGYHHVPIPFPFTEILYVTFFFAYPVLNASEIASNMISNSFPVSLQLGYSLSWKLARMLFQCSGVTAAGIVHSRIQ